MKWTNEKPIYIGYYWYRDDENDPTPDVVFVTGGEDGMATTVIWDEMFYEEPLNNVDWGQWCKIPLPD